MVFYIVGTLVISVIVASDDDLLLQGVSSGEDNAGASPFVIGIKRAGIRALDHIINAGKRTIKLEIYSQLTTFSHPHFSLECRE